MTESSDSTGHQGSDMISEPAERSRLLRWVLLDGNRLALAGLISAGIFLASVILVQVGLIPVFESGPLTTLTAGLVGGTLPFITIVLAINQLVLSQELGWVGTLRERMDEMQEFRRNVETLTETRVSPAAPAEFLRTLVLRTETLTQRLVEECEDVRDQEFQGDLADLTRMIKPRSARVAEALKDAEFGTFSALSASLDYNTGQYLYMIRHVRATHGDILPPGAEETLEELVDLLTSLDVARQYFKTLYTQHELAILSRLLLYAGFPALLGGGFVVLSYGTILQWNLGQTVMTLFLAGTIAVVFLPFSVLLAYTLRIATLASFTADFGPFVPKDTLSVSWGNSDE